MPRELWSARATTVARCGAGGERVRAISESVPESGSRSVPRAAGIPGEKSALTATEREASGEMPIQKEIWDFFSLAKRKMY